MADYDSIVVSSGAELDAALSLAQTALQPEYVEVLPAATDLTGAVIPIVQGGVNKKADAGLIVQSDGSVLAAIALTQAAYDALTPVSTTLYIITDA